MRQLIAATIATALSVQIGLHAQTTSRVTITHDKSYKFELNTYDHTAKVLRYTSGAETAIIPSTTTCDGETYRVTAINDSAFYDNNTIEVVIIPDGVETLGIRVFQHCDHLRRVRIGKDVRHMYVSIFNSCPKLEHLTVDPENKVYDSRDNCESVIETATNRMVFGSCNTTFPRSVVAIGDCAFYGRGIIQISIPKTVTVIGANAFKHCKSLMKIDIPRSVTELGHNIFSGCIKLQSVSLPPKITSIGAYSFHSCKELTEIIIPDKVTKIDEGAFQYCEKLKTIVLGKGILYICPSAFYGCESIQTLDTHKVNPQADIPIKRIMY